MFNNFLLFFYNWYKYLLKIVLLMGLFMINKMLLLFEWFFDIVYVLKILLYFVMNLIIYFLFLYLSVMCCMIVDFLDFEWFVIMIMLWFFILFFICLYVFVVINFLFFLCYWLNNNFLVCDFDKNKRENIKYWFYY